jgi:hypothetical protein
MIDITTTRLVALQTHPPVPIYVTLLLLALASSVIAGFGIGDTGNAGGCTPSSTPQR